MSVENALNVRIFRCDDRRWKWATSKILGQDASTRVFILDSDGSTACRRVKREQNTQLTEAPSAEEAEDEEEIITYLTGSTICAIS